MSPSCVAVSASTLIYRAGRGRSGGGWHHRGVTDHYDVIIVGTGAGGGTLANVLAQADRRILLLERGDFLPRELGNWDPEQVFVDGRYISSDTWYDAATAGRSSRRCTTTWAGRPRCTARRCTGCARRTSARSSTSTGCPRPGRSATTTSSRGTPRPNGSTRCAARTARTPPRVTGPGSTHGRRSRTRRGSSRSPTRSATAGYHPFHAPCGVLLDEGNRPFSPCIRCNTCDGFPCLVHAKSDAEVIAVRPVLDRPNVTLLVNAEVQRLETDAAGSSVTSVVVSRAGSTETYSGDIVVVSAGAANSARILLRSASDQHPAAWPTDRARWGATTCSTTATR